MESPSSRRPSRRRPRAPSAVPIPQSRETHEAALNSIRTFLKGRSSYDVFPVSFRLIVLDNKLEAKKALQALMLNGTQLAAHLPLTHDQPFTSCFV